jgi:tetratricopeptide (TPR) repeat protein
MADVDGVATIETSFRDKINATNGSPSSKLALARFLAEYADGDTEKISEAEKLYVEAIESISSKVNLLSVEKRELARIHAWYAVHLESQRKYNEAEDNYRKALTYDPNQALGVCVFAMRD